MTTWVGVSIRSPGSPLHELLVILQPGNLPAYVLVSAKMYPPLLIAQLTNPLQSKLTYGYLFPPGDTLDGVFSPNDDGMPMAFGKCPPQ